MKPISLYRGDSSNLISVRPNIKDDSEVISTDWICRTALIDSDGTELIAARVETTKTNDEKYFVVGLAPSDTLTKTIEAGKKYAVVYWVIQLSNDQLSPAYSKEKRIKVILREQAITA